MNIIGFLDVPTHGAYKFEGTHTEKFSDDQFMALITKRMTDAEMLELFNLINRLLKNHLTEAEYHSLFLKDEHGT